LGRKSGRGFYDYESEKSEKQANRDGKVTSESLDILVYDLNEAHPLLQRLRSAGHRLHEKPPQKQKVDAALILSESKEAIEDQMRMLVEGKQNDLTILAPGIALTHAELGTWLQGHAAWVFSYDSMFIEGSEQITLCFSSAADAGQLETVSALFSSCGLQPVWVKDAPALVLPRIVTMLINEAAFAVQDRVADAETIDRAMILGVNYPRGLLEWGAELGWQRVLAVLEHLYFEYREERYRPCRLIRQWAREEAART
jgi:3-hydroxybutyryl-CoA dehydrogenase